VGFAGRPPSAPRRRRRAPPPAAAADRRDLGRRRCAQCCGAATNVRAAERALHRWKRRPAGLQSPISRNQMP